MSLDFRVDTLMKSRAIRSCMMTVFVFLCLARTALMPFLSLMSPVTSLRRGHSGSVTFQMTSKLQMMTSGSPEGSFMISPLASTVKRRSLAFSSEPS